MEFYKYAVFGAGRQGRAIAYDLGKHGHAEEIIIADKDEEVVFDAASEVNTLLGNGGLVRPFCVDAEKHPDVVQVMLQHVNGFASALPYHFNPTLTKLAVETRCNMCDLGGNTQIVRQQAEHSEQAAMRGIHIAPDCGMAPGLNINLVSSALSRFERPLEARVYCGGIPKDPILPLGYNFPFSMDGLINEYTGYADVLREGKLAKQECLRDEIETVSLPGFGTLEAAYTSGGLSVAPWTLAKRYPSLRELTYKTLRYPGHWRIVRTLAGAGKLRSGLEAFERQHTYNKHDIGIIRVVAKGLNAGHIHTVTLDVVDTFDPKTGFTAMQRLTGFHASITLIMAVMGRFPPGVVSLDELPSEYILSEFEKRGIRVKKTEDEY